MQRRLHNHDDDCHPPQDRTCDSRTTSQHDPTQNDSIDTKTIPRRIKRRFFLQSVLPSILTFLPSSSFYSSSWAEETPSSSTSSSSSHENAWSSQSSFRTAAFGKEEYTNSIFASPDTNISPKEVYDSIASSYLQYPLEQIKKSPPPSDSTSSSSNPPHSRIRIPQALDIGAGAGVSTQILWNMGYHNIIAIDWSGSAWDRFVVQEGYCPPSVVFYELDDERYYDEWLKQKQLHAKDKCSNLANTKDSCWDNRTMDESDLFDVIVFNFAINESKALHYAQTMLNPSTGGRLLAPVNVQSDYWLKQVYRVYDSQGNILWNTLDVGAWSVLFQPDVTQDTCQGIWCAPFNGFEKKRK